MRTITHEFDLSTFKTRQAIDDLHARERAAPGRFDIRASRAEWLGVGQVENLSRVAALVLESGDHATTARVAEARREAQSLSVPAAKAIRPVLQARRVTGQRFDLDRVLAGDTHPWSRWERSQRDGTRIVSLSVPIGGTAGYSTEEIAWAPVAGIVVADLLEAAGYRVEIWGISRADQSNGTLLSMRCPLKAAQDYLDLNAVARICHPAVFRGVILPMRVAAFGGEPTVTDGYGSTQGIDPASHGDDHGIALRHTYNARACLAEINRALGAFQ